MAIGECDRYEYLKVAGTGGADALTLSDGVVGAVIRSLAIRLSCLYSPLFLVSPVTLARIMGPAPYRRDGHTVPHRNRPSRRHDGQRSRATAPPGTAIRLCDYRIASLLRWPKRCIASMPYDPQRDFEAIGFGVDFLPLRSWCRRNRR